MHLLASPPCLLGGCCWLAICWYLHSCSYSLCVSFTRWDWTAHVHFNLSFWTAQELPENSSAFFFFFFYCEASSWAVQNDKTKTPVI